MMAQPIMHRVTNIVERLISGLRQDAARAVASAHFIPHCLIVEDDKLDAEMTAEAIKLVGGVDATVAATGEEAIKMLLESRDQKRPPFHIVFLDLKLTGSKAQGEDVLQIIQDQLPGLHVALVSGHVTPEIIASNPGYVGIVNKPLHAQNLNDILVKHRLKAPDEVMI